MSLAIARDPPERLLPVLSTLTNYQAYYKEITEYLENMARQKIESLGSIKCEMESFLDESQHMMENMLTSIDTEVANALKDSQNNEGYQTSSEADVRQQEVEPYHQMRQSTLSIHDDRSIEKRSTRPKLKNKNKNKYERKYERTKKSHELVQKEREQIYNKIVAKQRQRSYSEEKAAKQRLKRNVKISQAHLKHFLTHFLDSQKQVHSMRMQKKIYIHICTMCDMMIHTSRLKSNLVRHYFKYHQVRINQDQPTIIPAEQLYQIYKKKIDNGDLVYYRCNCKTALCSSKEEYLSHIKQSHDNNVPSFSSHIFSKCQELMMEQPELIVNPEYNQYCILEDVIIGEIFYCGKCQISFRYCAQLYYDHLVMFHKGVDDHPGNSHILKKQLIPSLKKLPQNRRGTTIQKFVHDQKIKYQRKSSKQKDQIQSNVNHKKKTKIYIYKQHFDENGLQFPEQKIFLEALQKYNGPFICSHCNKDFRNFTKIKEHFEDKNVIEQQMHKFCQEYFLRITVVLKDSNTRYRYYIPRKMKDQGLYDQILKVPIKGVYNFEIKQYKKMSLRELIDFVETRSLQNKLYYRGVSSSAFCWPLK